MTDSLKPVRLSNKNNNKNLVEIFVRNYQKKAIRLLLEKKLNMTYFRQIIYERMKIKTEDQAIFLQGKLIEYDEDELDLHNGFIFHLVNLSRVKISAISINVKRIEPNSTVYKFTLQPEMLIGQFIKEVLTTKFEEITNYFMVYTGRELQSDKTFIEQYIQDGSQILLIHKVQNRKSQAVQNKKRTKSSRLKKQELQQVGKQKQVKKNLNENFNSFQFSIKENKDKQQKKIESENENQKQNNEKYQLVNNSFKYEVHGSQQPKQQQHNNKSQELNQKQLYQTEKLNKNQVLNQQDSQNEQQTEIIINNYNAFTYNPNPSNLNQKPISPIKNTTVHPPNQQILTRYGLVPQKQLTRIDRSSEQEDTSHIVLGDSIQLLNQRSSMELKSKNEEVEQSKNQQKQSEFYDQYLKVSNGSYQKMNSFLLKTISSKYDDQGISLENSQRKREQENELSYVQSLPYSGGIKSSLKYRIRENLMQNTQNVESHKSFKETTNQNLEVQDQNRLQTVEQNNTKVEQLNQQHLKMTKARENDTEPKKKEQRLDQSFLMGGQKKNEDKFVKKQNMIEVKDLTKTVDPDFYKAPNLQTSAIVMSKQKLTYRSQLKGNAKQPQTPSRNMEDLSQIERNSEQERMLQNVAFVNNPMGHVGHVEIKNQILEGASKTYSVEEGDDEIIKQIRVTKISQKNDILSQNSSGVSGYNFQSQSSDNPFKKMIEMANKHVKFQLSPEEKQKLADQNNEAKYINIYNVSYVSSGYQTSVADSNQPINQFAYNPNTIYLPNLSNYGTGRESFISDAPEQMYDKSQKFSGTSVESEIISSTQYPKMNPPFMRYTQQKQYRIDLETGKEVQLEQIQKLLWEDQQQDKQEQTLQKEEDKMSLSMKKNEKKSDVDIKTTIHEEITGKTQQNQENISQTRQQQKDIPITEINAIVTERKKFENMKQKEQTIQQDSLLLESSSKNIQSSQHIFGQSEFNKENELLNYLGADPNPKPLEKQKGFSDSINGNYEQQLTHNNNSLQCGRTVKKTENAPYLSFSFSYEKEAMNPERNIPFCFNVGDMIMTGIGQSSQIRSYAQRIRQQIYREFSLTQESQSEGKEGNKNKAGENIYGFNNKEISKRQKIEEYLEQYTKNRQPLHNVLRSESLVEKQQSNLMQDQQLYQNENQQKQNKGQDYEQNLLNDYL